MSFSPLPLGYCTNVHPGLTTADVLQGLKRFTLPVRTLVESPVAAGLWLAQPVVREILSDPSALHRFSRELKELELPCYSLNAFPYGDFHSDRVKDRVYLPDWSTPERLLYTQNCATILAHALPDRTDGSISTLPLGFKGHRQSPDFLQIAIRNLIDLAKFLDRLRQHTGKTVRLAIEPEPFCLLETTPETLDFFRHLFNSAEDSKTSDLLREFIGVCYDVCHQAVEFEDVESSIRSLDQAAIRLNKLHITCAIQLDHPSRNRAGRRALAAYAEPRYLHQAMGRKANGDILRFVDLTPDFADSPDEDWEQADPWRIHFHVPVDSERIGPLGTTRPQLIEALRTVAGLNYSPHLEVETYTWGVLPGKSPLAQDETLVRGLSRELLATGNLIADISRHDPRFQV